MEVRICEKNMLINSASEVSVNSTVPTNYQQHSFAVMVPSKAIVRALEAPKNFFCFYSMIIAGQKKNTKWFSNPLATLRLTSVSPTL